MSCTGKRRYITFVDADRTAKRVRRQQDKSHVEAYHCARCAGFHIGASLDYLSRKREL